MKYQELTEQVIGSIYKVYNTLGYGFLEKVYENAMIIELSKQGLEVKNQVPIKVMYDSYVVGEYIADLLVEDKVILELKAMKRLTQNEESQLLNYLTATNKEVGLLLNFAEHAEIKRKIYDNERKPYYQ